jgi:Uma2 family endonuclease
MSPSPEHEEVRSVVGPLLMAYCEHAGIDAYAKGSTTYRSESAGRGLEADESYSFGAYKATPDLAIDVVHTSHRIDKLDVYRGLGVAEVWVIEAGALTIHVLTETGYVVSKGSRVLPGIDVALLASFVKTGESTTRLLREYRAALASR